MQKIRMILVFTLFVIACDPEQTSKLHLPSVNGKAGEVLLILEDGYWQDTIGNYFKDLLLAEVPGLPQIEPLFDVSQIPNSGFSKMLQASRNIVRVNIQKNLKPAINFKKDVWAEPQIYIQMQAPNEQELLNLLDKHGIQMVDYLLEAERNRNFIRAKQYEAIEIERKLKSKHQLSMIIPKDFQLYQEKKNFIWLKKETRNYLMGIFIYYYNYTDTNTFSVEYLIHKRDSVLKLNVPGENKGSYMTTEHRIDPILTHLKYKKRYFAEVRARWDVVNDAMGGPFVSYTTLDKKRNRIVTLEGFAYYPNNNKRDLIRQLEAILLTVDFDDK